MHLQTCRAHIKVSVVAGVPCSNTTCVHVRLDPQHPLCVTDMFKAAHLLSHRFVWVWCAVAIVRVQLFAFQDILKCVLCSPLPTTSRCGWGSRYPMPGTAAVVLDQRVRHPTAMSRDALREAVILPRRHCWRMYYRAMYPWRFSSSQSSSSSPLYKRHLGPPHVESVEMRSAWEFFATVRSCRELSLESVSCTEHTSPMLFAQALLELRWICLRSL